MAWAELTETRAFLKDRARTEEHPIARSSALSALAQHFRNEPETKPLLLDRARDDTHETVRIAALWALAQQFRDEPETKPLLLDRACNDVHETVRSAALLRWAQGFRSRADVLLLSRDLDGVDPGIDPHTPIDVDRVRQAAAKLGTEDEVRRAYEALAEEVPLRLAWREQGVAEARRGTGTSPELPAAQPKA